MLLGLTLPLQAHAAHLYPYRRHSNLFPTNLKATAKDGGVRIETGTEIETTADMACNLARMTPLSQGLFACCKVAMCSSTILFASDWPTWM